MACHRLFAPRVGLSFVGCPSMTHQEFKHDSDINAIVLKFLRTGQINVPNADRPLVDGFEAIGDFTESCNRFFDEVNQDKVSQIASGSEHVSEPSEQQPSEPGSEDSHSSGVSDLESGQKS